MRELLSGKFRCLGVQTSSPWWGRLLLIHLITPTSSPGCIAFFVEMLLLSHLALRRWHLRWTSTSHTLLSLRLWSVLPSLGLVHSLWWWRLSHHFFSALLLTVISILFLLELIVVFTVSCFLLLLLRRLLVLILFLLSRHFLSHWLVLLLLLPLTPFSAFVLVIRWWSWSSWRLWLLLTHILFRFLWWSLLLWLKRSLCWWLLRDSLGWFWNMDLLFLSWSLFSWPNFFPYYLSSLSSHSCRSTSAFVSPWVSTSVTSLNNCCASCNRCPSIFSCILVL